jgi:hypothetical protein
VSIGGINHVQPRESHVAAAQRLLVALGIQLSACRQFA